MFKKRTILQPTNIAVNNSVIPKKFVLNNRLNTNDNNKEPELLFKKNIKLVFENGENDDFTLKQTFTIKKKFVKKKYNHSKTEINSNTNEISNDIEVNALESKDNFPIYDDYPNKIGIDQMVTNIISNKLKGCAHENTLKNIFQDSPRPRNKVFFSSNITDSNHPITNSKFDVSKSLKFPSAYKKKNYSLHDDNLFEYLPDVVKQNLLFLKVNYARDSLESKNNILIVSFQNDSIFHEFIKQLDHLKSELNHLLVYKQKIIEKRHKLSNYNQIDKQYSSNVEIDGLYVMGNMKISNDDYLSLNKFHMFVESFTVLVEEKNLAISLAKKALIKIELDFFKNKKDIRKRFIMDQNKVSMYIFDLIRNCVFNSELSDYNNESYFNVVDGKETALEHLNKIFESSIMYTNVIEVLQHKVNHKLNLDSIDITTNNSNSYFYKKRLSFSKAVLDILSDVKKELQSIDYLLLNAIDILNKYPSHCHTDKWFRGIRKIVDFFVEYDILLWDIWITNKYNHYQYNSYVNIEDNINAFNWYHSVTAFDTRLMNSSYYLVDYIVSEILYPKLFYWATTYWTPLHIDDTKKLISVILILSRYKNINIENCVKVIMKKLNDTIENEIVSLKELYTQDDVLISFMLFNTLQVSASIRLLKEFLDESFYNNVVFNKLLLASLSVYQSLVKYSQYQNIIAVVYVTTFVIVFNGFTPIPMIPTSLVNFIQSTLSLHL